MNRKVKKRINKFASFTLATTLVGSGLVGVSLVQPNITLAAKNADGVSNDGYYLKVLPQY